MIFYEVNKHYSHQVEANMRYFSKFIVFSCFDEELALKTPKL